MLYQDAGCAPQPRAPPDSMTLAELAGLSPAEVTSTIFAEAPLKSDPAVAADVPLVPDSDEELQPPVVLILPPPKVDVVVEQMLRRADVVERLGQWWGFFDWLLWGYVSLTKVYIWFGSNKVDVSATFSHEDQAPAQVGSKIIHVAACKGHTVARGDLPEVSHFVLLEPLENMPAVSKPLEDQSAWLAARFETSMKAGAAELNEFYMDLGFAVIPTTLSGDCGPDACAQFENSSGPLAWKAHRKRVASAIRAYANEDWAKAAFVACQELAPPSSAGSSSRLSLEASSASASGSPGSTGSRSPSATGAPFASAIGVPLASTMESYSSSGNLSRSTLTAASGSSGAGVLQGCAGKGSLELPEASKGQESRKVVSGKSQGASDAPSSEAAAAEAALTWALHRTGVNGDHAVAVWLPRLAEEEIAVLKREHASWLAEAGKVKKRLPARSYTSSLLTIRIRTGKLYLEWKRDRPDDKASLRNFALKYLCAGPAVSKKLRQFIVRCEQAAKQPTAVLSLGKGFKRKGTSFHTVGSKRRRMFGSQGRPALAPEVRQALFQWFVDTRASIKGRRVYSTLLVWFSFCNPQAYSTVSCGSDSAFMIHCDPSVAKLSLTTFSFTIDVLKCTVLTARHSTLLLAAGAAISVKVKYILFDFLPRCRVQRFYLRQVWCTDHEIMEYCTVHSCSAGFSHEQCFPLLASWPTRFASIMWTSIKSHRRCRSLIRSGLEAGGLNTACVSKSLVGSTRSAGKRF